LLILPPLQRALERFPQSNSQIVSILEITLKGRSSSVKVAALNAFHHCKCSSYAACYLHGRYLLHTPHASKLTANPAGVLAAIDFTIVRRKEKFEDKKPTSHHPKNFVGDRFSKAGSQVPSTRRAHTYFERCSEERNRAFAAPTAVKQLTAMFRATHYHEETPHERIVRQLFLGQAHRTVTQVLRNTSRQEATEWLRLNRPPKLCPHMNESRLEQRLVSASSNSY